MPVKKKFDDKYFRALIENSNEGIAVVNLHGEILYVSPTINKVLGCIDEEMMRDGYFKFVHPEYAEVAQEIFQNFVSGGVEFRNVEIKMKHKNGNYIWVEANITNMLNNEDIKGIVVNFRDIDEKKQAEEKLKFNSMVFDKISDNIVVTDLEGRVSYCNDVVLKTLQREKHEIIGKEVQFFGENPEKGARQQEIKDNVKEKGYWEGEVVNYDSKGNEVILYSRIQIVKDEAGKPVAMVGVSTDITEKKKTESELQKSEEKFRSLFYDHSVMKLIIDPETGNIIEANKAAAEFYGWRVEQLEKMSILDINTLPEEEVREAIRKARNSRNNHFEFKHRRADGSVSDVEVFSSTVIIRGKCYLHSVIHDITEKKKAEIELAKSEEKFRQIYKNIQTGIARVSLDFTIMNANDAYCKMLGYSESELIGKHLKDITHLETLEENLKKQTDLGKGTIDAYFMEKKFIHRDGHTVYGILNANLIRDEKGKPDYFIGSVVDITKRKEAEETLRKSEEKYRCIADNMTDVVWTSDLNANLTFITPSIEKLTGETVEENMKRTVEQRFTPQSLAKVIPMFQEELEKEKDPGCDKNRSRLVEAEQLRKDGSVVYVSMNISFIRDMNGNPVGFLGITRDLTEKKKAEMEKEKLREQLNQSQKMESIGRLAGGVAHDFNNMLSVILGRSEIALQKAVPESRFYTELNEIKTAAERSADLTAQLLAFARKQVVSPKVISVNEEIRKISGMLKRLMGEDLDIVFEFSEDVRNIRIDPSQISQILTNLCINSKDAGAKEITVLTEISDAKKGARGQDAMQGEYQILKIRDDGSGMDEKTLKKIFEPFFTTKRIGQGTGLGLSTIYGIIKQNRGSIQVTSEIGAGTEFTILFPTVKEKKSREENESENYEFLQSGHTVLLVEDETAILEMTTMMLESFGYKVFAAETPGEAINKAVEISENIDILLTDVVMPEMNGRELAKKIMQFHPEIKNVFMSGYTADVIARQGVLDEGMNFLHKPFTMKRLREKLEQVLRKNP